MRVQVSRTVKVPREKVFAAYSDIESMPKWSGRLSATRVVSRSGNLLTYEGEVKNGGGVRRFVGSLAFVPLERAETESETRFVTTKAVVTFADVPEGTRVTTTLDVNTKGIWGRLLATNSSEELKARAEENLNLFAKYVEGLP